MLDNILDVNSNESINHRTSRRRKLAPPVFVNLKGYPGQVYRLLASIPQRNEQGKLNGITRYVLGRQTEVKHLQGKVWQVKHVFNRDLIKPLSEGGIVE